MKPDYFGFILVHGIHLTTVQNQNTKNDAVSIL